MENKLSVLVIGSLGELVKKVIETDLRVVENHKDTSAYIEGVSLKKVLDEWPVLDEGKVYMLCKVMRLTMMRYKHVEKEIEAQLKGPLEPNPTFAIDHNAVWLRDNVANLFKFRDELRFHIAELNKQSGGVGKASAIPEEADLVVAKIGE